MDLEKEISELKDALEYTINDYRYLALSKEKGSVEDIIEILRDHKAMAKRWKLKLKKLI